MPGNACRQRFILALFCASRKLVIKIEGFAAARSKQGVDAIGFVTEIGYLHGLLRVGVIATAEHVEEIAIAVSVCRRLKRFYPVDSLTYVVGRRSTGIAV
ncbi:MAG TPA: hypothetical protein PKE16_08505 [Hyphomicrobium sp.]|nr:hypothetical protein [Hyphomicrobium sp.]